MSIISEQGEDKVREPSNTEEPAAANLREPSNSEGAVQEPGAPREPSNEA